MRLDHGRPTLGEGAGLVQREQGDVPERLDGREAADDRAPARHPPRAEREAERDHDRQGLRDGGHREREGRDDDQQRGLTAQHPEEGDCGARDDGGHGEPSPETGHLLLERRGP